MKKEPLFLTLTEVLRFHEYQIKRFGGELGIRDSGLLESAIAQPQGFYGGQWLHSDLYAMAAAYAFHICKDHPFIDGNKRTALASALVFLEINGISLLDPDENLPDAVEGIAKSEVSKQEFADILRKLPREK